MAEVDDCFCRGQDLTGKSGVWSEENNDTARRSMSEVDDETVEVAQRSCGSSEGEAMSVWLDVGKEDAEQNLCLKTCFGSVQTPICLENCDLFHP